MLSIESILTYLYKEVQTESGRITVLDDEHIFDTKTGVELHMYDDRFKVTHGKDTVATDGYFTSKESEIVWAIKQLITDPTKAAKRREEYPVLVGNARQYLSDLFQNPSPPDAIAPMVEAGTSEYTG